MLDDCMDMDVDMEDADTATVDVNNSASSLQQEPHASQATNSSRSAAGQTSHNPASATPKKAAPTVVYDLTADSPEQGLPSMSSRTMAGGARVCYGMCSCVHLPAPRLALHPCWRIADEELHNIYACV